jgi:hypothetical protein
MRDKYREIGKLALDGAHLSFNYYDVFDGVIRSLRLSSS